MLGGSSDRKRFLATMLLAMVIMAVTVRLVSVIHMSILCKFGAFGTYDYAGSSFIGAWRFNWLMRAGRVIIAVSF